MPTRQCSACEALLDVSLFYVSGGRFSSYCTSCTKAKASKWARENRARINERRRKLTELNGSEYTPKDPKERAAQYAKYSQRNKAILAAALKERGCDTCHTKDRLVSKLDGAAVSTMLECSVLRLHDLIQRSRVQCKACWRAEEDREWANFDPNEVRTCQKCLCAKPSREFTLPSKFSSIRTCKQCSKKEVEVRIEKCRMFIAPLKEEPCTDCGWEFEAEAMDFDHLPQHKKKQAISRLVKLGNLEALQAELKKCELVCSNCHRIRTARRRKQQETNTP